MNRDPGFEDTNRLLLSLLRGEAGVDDLPAPQEELAWRGLVEQAKRLGLDPWLHCLFRDERERLPEEAWQTLWWAYWSTAGDNCRFLSELERIVAAFAAAQVPVVLLKGATLLEGTFPGLGSRSMCDLDILVPTRHVDEARAVLESLDYEAEDTDALGHTEQFLRAFGGEMGFVCREGQGIYVELHWRLIHYDGAPELLAIDYDGLWERALPVAGRPGALVLSPVDNLLYLALHLALHHRLAGLRTFFDVDRVLRAHEVDWEELVGRADAWRCRHVAYMVLALCKELFATPVPAEVLHTLRPSRARLALLGRLVGADRIRSGEADIGSKGERLLHLLLVDRGRDIWRSLWRTIWPEREWLALRYSPASMTQLRWYRLRHLKRMTHYAWLSARDVLRLRNREEATR